MSSTALKLDQFIKVEDGTPNERLLGLIDKHSGRTRRAFLKAVAFIKNERTLGELADLLSVGRIDVALESVERAMRTVANTVSNTAIATGASTAEVIAENLNVAFSFNQVNERAIGIVQRSNFELIRNFTQEQTRATQRAILDGLNTGANPIEQARRFRDSIGLTDRQQSTVGNFRRLLQEGDTGALTRGLRDKRFDGTIRRVFAAGEKLTESQVSTMTTRYADRLLKHRSEVIARTESLRAVNQADHEAWVQATEEGVVKKEELIREWVPANDFVVRDSHEAMRGQEAILEEPFISGLGNQLMFPGDPAAPGEDTINCRCVITTRIK